MRTCGIDIGARSIDLVLLEGDVPLLSRVEESGPNPQERAESVFLESLDGAGLRPEDLSRTVATGYGRKHFRAASETISEISCHAAGVRRLVPDASVIVDIGGQDSKVIEVGPDGRVLRFAMNDRCAAGTGRFLEIVAQTLRIPIEDAGRLALEGEGGCEINAMCAVFAETEIVGLLHGGTPRGTILRGVFRAVARRTRSLLGRIEPSGRVVLTGGVARNAGVVRALGEELGVEIVVPPGPELTGALGAAILATRKAGNGRKRGES